MALRRLLLFLCLLLALVCLAGGYAAAGRWVGGLVALVPAGGLALHGKLRQPWLLPACLVGLVALAAAGLLLGAPALLMLPGAAASLAAWDLANLDRKMAEGDGAAASARRFERRHALALAAALGSGLLLAASGRLLTLQIPFVLLLLVVVVDLLSLDFAARYVK